MIPGERVQFLSESGAIPGEYRALAGESPRLKGVLPLFHLQCSWFFAKTRIIK